MSRESIFFVIRGSSEVLGHVVGALRGSRIEGEAWAIRSREVTVLTGFDRR